MNVLLAASLLGIVAGLRTMTAPAAISWAARLGLVPLQGTPLAFLGSQATPWIFTAAALGELVVDQLPRTPSRKMPLPFGARIVSGGFCGAAIGLAGGELSIGLLAGALGAVLGTLGGAAARGALARALRSDRPAALIEDVVAIGGAAVAVAWLA
ncbi:DUF4126 domain-containing protein [Dyella sp.]|jgi:uncharacterized membrane protein|uniref:DUF4126 domain-containing protein n=1 Tax=Dyella sp. TaxID=1869338 RepID=UPI002D79515B|nr:DUF4126 domain-containing protein [Dyella sp.]HET6432997.1 DUF4126 domain-containing protein [Dyella sp.]